MSELPKAKYEGKIMLGGIEIECCVLDDGRRIITEQGLINFINAMEVASKVEIERFANDFSKFKLEEK